MTDRGPAGPSSTSAPSTVLHSSLTGIVSVLLGVGLLAVLSVVGLFSAGFTWVTGPLVLITLIAAGAALFDMPVSSVFDAEGVTRRALVRHQRLHWDDVNRLSRVRKGMFRSSKASPTGGLIAVRGRRNYTLVDRMEGHQEHAALRLSLGAAGERLGVDRIAQPPLDQTPTWLHRRAKWAPENQR